MMLDNRATDPSQNIADLRRQLDQRTDEVKAVTAERDEAIAQPTKPISARPPPRRIIRTIRSGLTRRLVSS